MIPAGRQPLVSCIMPTHNRRRFLPRAIAYFLRQDLPAKELVIVDDGADDVADLVPAIPSIRYHRVHRRMVLGAARNLACELAAGSLIAHWDDDDWQAPDRLSRQARLLGSGRIDICGMTSLLFFDPAGRRAWRYTWPRERHRWLAGQTLCFRRDLWARSPFPAVPAGEDTAFVWQSTPRSVAAVDPGDSVVALAHPGNTVPKTSRGVHRAPATMAEVISLLGQDFASYPAEAAGDVR